MDSVTIKTLSGAIESPRIDQFLQKRTSLNS